MKRHQQQNYATVQIKQLDIQEDTWKRSGDEEGTELSGIPACRKPNGRSIGALWFKKTHINKSANSLNHHRVRFYIFHFSCVGKRSFGWHGCNEEPTSADIRSWQEQMLPTGVSVQIHLQRKPSHVGKDLTWMKGRYRHRQDFPLTLDSGAIYSTHALWRRMFAVIIQLIGCEKSRPAMAATVWTCLEDRRSV